jgi:hypothetical protein
VFADQSGFHLLPTVVRTYAPVGRTRILKENLTRDHLVGDEHHNPRWQALHDLSGALLQGGGCGTFSKASHAPDSGQVISGLGWLSDPSRTGRKGVSRKWDGFWSAARTTTRLYAPNLNPEEGVCKHLKYVELKNLCCESLSELKIELRKAKERLRHKRDVILGCIRQPGFVL